MKKEYLPGQFHILVLIMMKKIKQKKQQQTDFTAIIRRKSNIKYIQNSKCTMYQLICMHTMWQSAQIQNIYFGLKHIWF